MRARATTQTRVECVLVFCVAPTDVVMVIGGDCVVDTTKIHVMLMEGDSRQSLPTCPNELREVAVYPFEYEVPQFVQTLLCSVWRSTRAAL